MFKRLQQKWKVNGWGLFLILTTFALGGSLCGWMSRVLLKFTGWEKNAIWWITYLLLISLLWPVCVIIISIPLGQYRFFLSYLKRIRKKLFGHDNSSNRQDQ